MHGELILPAGFVCPKSQVYRSCNVTGAPYEAPPPPGSFHGDYAYDAYMSNFSSAQGFPEYGYPADTGWPTMEQGVCGQGPVWPQVQGTESPCRVASQAWDEKQGVSCN